MWHLGGSWGLMKCEFLNYWLGVQESHWVTGPWGNEGGNCCWGNTKKVFGVKLQKHGDGDGDGGGGGDGSTLFIKAGRVTHWNNSAFDWQRVKAKGIMDCLGIHKVIADGRLILLMCVCVCVFQQPLLLWWKHLQGQTKMWKPFHLIAC